MTKFRNPDTIRLLSVRRSRMRVIQSGKAIPQSL